MFSLLRTKRVASELGAKSFRTLYICLTLDLARRVSRGSHPLERLLREGVCICDTDSC